MLREAYLTVTANIDRIVSPGGPAEPALSDLLFRLARTPSHALRTVDITRALATSSTRTTRLVDEAESRGWVQRGSDPADRRAIVVSLTDDGLDEARRRGQLAMEATQRHVHGVLTAAEVEAMTRVLHTLRDANREQD